MHIESPARHMTPLKIRNECKSTVNVGCTKHLSLICRPFPLHQVLYSRTQNKRGRAMQGTSLDTIQHISILFVDCKHGSAQMPWARTIFLLKVTDAQYTRPCTSSQLRLQETEICGADLS